VRSGTTCCYRGRWQRGSAGAVVPFSTRLPAGPPDVYGDGDCCAVLLLPRRAPEQPGPPAHARSSCACHGCSWTARRGQATVLWRVPHGCRLAPTWTTCTVSGNSPAHTRKHEAAAANKGRGLRFARCHFHTRGSLGAGTARAQEPRCALQGGRTASPQGPRHELPPGQEPRGAPAGRTRGHVCVEAAAWRQPDAEPAIPAMPKAAAQPKPQSRRRHRRRCGGCGRRGLSDNVRRAALLDGR